jgi:mRNA-degrading endonuclease toxin of MazEF toxin-antitoxin module
VGQVLRKRDVNATNPGPSSAARSQPSTIQAENITTVRKSSLRPPNARLRKLSESTIEKIARGVQIAMGFPDRA